MTYLNHAACTAMSILALAATFSAAPDRAAAGPNPFLGDIVPAGYNFCPRGWASAEGQLLAISSNTALFSLLGTTYGGDGRTNFGLPDLRGRVGTAQGTGPGLTPATIGGKFGQEGAVLSPDQLPAHSHTANANNLDGDQPGPGGKLLAAAPTNGAGSETIYSDQPANVTMSPQMIATAGGNQPLSVEDPYLVLRYCIALQGVYPPRD